MTPVLRYLIALPLALSAAAIDAQTFKYLAFGDSITCGKYDQPLVCSGDGTINPLSGTGYPGRLRTQLSCTGGNSSCEVYNYGDPGESTSEGLSRIGGVLDNGNNGPYDVVLLMHGTNDVFGNTSNTTIKNNLKAMDDKAAARGVDTVFASIIEFHYQGTKPGKNTQIKNLKNDIRDVIAPDRDSWFANPWGVLCGNFSNSCFDNHYANIPNPDFHGLHPDASGFNRMANEFEATIKQHLKPTTPSLQSPADGAGVASTTVTWSATANTTWYQVEWTNPAKSQWVQAKEDASCGGGGTCTWTIPGLGPGPHDWRVRGRNPRGRSAYSGWRSFTFYTSPPATPDTMDPVADIYDGVEPTEFVWEDVDVATNGVTRYQLNIERDGETVFNEDVTNPTCSADACSHDPGITWEPGNYRWRVRSENPAGASAWSSPWTEFLFTNVAPTKPTPIQPTVDTFDTKPVFEWTHVFGAEEYRIQVLDDSSSQVINELLTAAGICSVTSCSWKSDTTLQFEDHTWKVRAENPQGESDFSAIKSFAVLACAPLELLLDSDTVNGPADEAACETITAEGNYRVGSTGDLELHAGDKIAFNDHFTVASGGKLHCRVDP